MKEKSIRNKKKTRKIIRNVIFWLLIAGFLAWFAALKLDLESDPNTYDYVIPSTYNYVEGTRDTLTIPAIYGYAVQDYKAQVLFLYRV